MPPDAGPKSDSNAVTAVIIQANFEHAWALFYQQQPGRPASVWRTTECRRRICAAAVVCL